MRLLRKSLELGTVLAAFGLFLSPGGILAEESPWYVEVGFGQAETEAVFGSRRPKPIDDESQATAFAVGYGINRYLAVEAGFHDFGSPGGFGSPCREDDEICVETLASLGLCVEGFQCGLVAVRIDAEITGLSLAAVPRWPVTDRLSVLGKVGVMSWESETFGDSGFGRIEDFSGEDLLLGVGVQYDFSNGLGVRLQYEEFDLDVRTATAGVSWRF